MKSCIQRLKPGDKVLVGSSGREGFPCDQETYIVSGLSKLYFFIDPREIGRQNERDAVLLGRVDSHPVFWINSIGTTVRGCKWFCWVPREWVLEIIKSNKSDD